MSTLIPDLTPAQLRRQEAAVGRMRRLLNEGALALLTACGDEWGLLRVIRTGEPAPAAAIAGAARLDARLVEGWLGAMVAGAIIEYDGTTNTYCLPREHAAFLEGEEGRVLRGGFVALLGLAGSVRGLRAGKGTQPPVSHLLDLIPGAVDRLGSGACVLIVGDGATRAVRSVRAWYPTGRFVARVSMPSDSRRRFDVILAIDEGAMAGTQAARGLARLLRPGGSALLAVTAMSGHPADDALHPLAAYLAGTRALTIAGGSLPTDVHIGERLADAGLEVTAVGRVRSDPFRNFLLVHKPE